GWARPAGRRPAARRRAPGPPRTRCARWRRSTAPRSPSPRVGARPGARPRAGGCRPAAAPAAPRDGSGSRPRRGRAGAIRRRGRRRSRCWRCRDRSPGRSSRHTFSVRARTPPALWGLPRAGRRRAAVRSLSITAPAAQPAARSDVLADVIRLARSSLCTGGRGALVALLCLSACALLAASLLAGTARAARSRAPALAPNDAVIDGPSADIQALNGMSVSRDGGGALVYTKAVAGVAHVFVSRLSGGVFQAPVQADAGLPGPSSRPVIAAGQNGLLLVAFSNGGSIYVAQAPSAASPLSPPAALAIYATNPSLSLNVFGKAYLAYTDAGGAGGGDVRVAYYFQGRWTQVPGSLDATPTDAAGTATGRPDVVASGDG